MHIIADVNSISKTVQRNLTFILNVLSEVKPSSETIYHSKMRDFSVVIYNLLKIYATVRSEYLINKLYSLGLCIPYKRVLEITTNMAEYNIKRFDIDKFSFQSTLTKMSLLSSQKTKSI